MIFDWDALNANHTPELTELYTVVVLQMSMFAIVTAAVMSSIVMYCSLGWVMDVNYGFETLPCLTDCFDWLTKKYI